MIQTGFDAVRAWDKIADHLDTIPLAEVADRLGLHTKIINGHRGPMVCPRYECRSPRVWTVGESFDCPLCGAGGRSAALFAAAVAGWVWRDGDDRDEVARDFVGLAREALFAGLVPTDDAWTAFYAAIPGFDEWHEGQRGVFEGEERAKRLRALAAVLRRTDMSGASLVRTAWAWNCAFCRPPLPANECAAIVSGAGSAA